MDTCPSEVLDLILTRMKASNDRAAAACVSRLFLASARRVGLGGSAREGRYGSFPGQVIGLAACPRGKTLLVVTRRRRDGFQCYKEGRIHVVDALNGTVLRSLHASYWGSSIACSPDGESFVAIDVEKANIYTVATLEKRRGLDVPEEPRNGHAAYAVAWGARRLCVMFFCSGSPPPREWYEAQPEEPLTLLWDPEQLDAPPRVHVTDRLAQSATCLVLTDSAALMVGKFDNCLFRVPFDGEPGAPLPLPDFDQRPGVVAIVDTPHGVLLVTISGKAVCVEGDVCVQKLDIGVGVNACCYDGAYTVFAATDAGVVRIHHAEGCWRVAGAVGDPCTSIALLRTTGSLVTSHVDWEDITVSRPTFPACMEFALAAKPGGPRPKFPRAPELLACSATHAFVAPPCWGVERGLACVDMRRYVSVYTSFLPGAAHAVFPTPNMAEALVVLVSNLALSSNDEVEDNAQTHVALVSPHRMPVELAKIPQRFEGAAEVWSGALYLSGRAGVAMIEDVLAAGPLTVKSLTRTSCVCVRVEPSLNAPAGRGRVIGTMLNGADLVVRDTAAVDLSSELGGLRLGPRG